jgi:putative FmdB family regulatory protein
MPLYEYECKKCGHRFEKIQLYSARMVKKCPECGGVVEQMISAPAVQFKGSGWYVSSAPAGESSASRDSKESKDSSKESSKESKKEDKPKPESAAKESSSKKADKRR